MSDASHPPVPTSVNHDGGATPPPQVVVVTQGGRLTAWWVLTVLAAVAVAALVMSWDQVRFADSVLAQATGGGGLTAGKQYVYAFSGQLTSKTYGVFMVDVDTGTLWCYELHQGPRDQLQMRLAAARSWIFDRYLEEFNVGDPIPGAVRQMVQQQRSHRSDAEDEVASERGRSPLFPGGESPQTEDQQ